MRLTRSSRFFLILLHLVGVSTHVRPKLTYFLQFNVTSIQTPHLISLQISDPSVKEFLEISMQPHWLQDSLDQKCLGPMANWAECGDSNLWRIIPNTRRHAKRRQWIRWATEEEEEEDLDRKLMENPQSYALQIVDDVESMLVSNSRKLGAPISKADNFVGKECLSRRRKDNKLVTVPCSQDRAWFWKVNQRGILHFDKPQGGTSSGRNNVAAKRRLLNKRLSLECVWRNASEALLYPCDGHHPTEPESYQNRTNVGVERPVLFHFVRRASDYDTEYIADDDSAESSLLRNTISIDAVKRKSNSAPETFQITEMIRSYATGPSNLPSHRDKAHNNAVVSGKHTGEAQLATPSLLPHQSPEAFAKELPRLLGYSNPILFVAKAKNRGAANDGSMRHQTAPKKTDSAPTRKPMVRKIQVNPYIASSKNERWTDPQTGLVYHTDLCQYLGHDRHEVGRHTLTGVGQYTKTMLNIKVYGVAFYVSKRDILADSNLEAFASLSTKELRDSPRFFETLRKMDGFSSSNGPAGKFDRTLFLKTNMQLATETMRSSLDADWKMLTPEAKDLLIGSSMKSRPAAEDTLRMIDSLDNPSRCSCAQIAPDEYNADPSCCARGTELVFTWRKNGNLEIRLNGIFIDSFPRPDIAEGIFFEYLRMDNPMSFDFLDRVVEGFSFLLAPLAQVKGVASPIMTQPYTQYEAHTPGNHFLRSVSGIGGALSAQAATFADILQSGAHELSRSAMEKAKSVESAARSLGEDLERKRELIGKHVSAFTHQALSTFYPKDKKSVSIPLTWISDAELSRISRRLNQSNEGPKEDEYGCFTRSVCYALGLEVCATLSATEATRRLLFSFVHIFVHMYLLLLLIASFPDQSSTRTKVVFFRKNSPPSYNVSEYENSDSDDSVEPLAYIRIDPMTDREQEGVHLKKRLYLL